MTDPGNHSTPFEALVAYEQRSLAHVAGPPDEIETAGLWRGVGFRIGKRHLACGIAEVSEIIAYPSSLTAVPGAKRWLLGIANVRGNLVPVIDLRDFIDQNRSTANSATRVMMVRQQGGNAGLMVDEVFGQRSFSEQQLAASSGEADANYVRFVNKNVRLGDVSWGVFDMTALTCCAEFLRAAA